MLKRSALALTIAGSLALGSCAGTTALIPIIGPAITAAITIPNVQSAATTLCRFLPLAVDVASLIAANPLVSTAEALANMICGGLPTTLAARRGAPLGANAVASVNGISVRGHFVN